MTFNAFLLICLCTVLISACTETFLFLNTSVLICLFIQGMFLAVANHFNFVRPNIYCLECPSWFFFQLRSHLASLKRIKPVIITMKLRAIQNEPDIIWEHADEPFKKG